jgi:hypothetical protein
LSQFSPDRVARLKAALATARCEIVNADGDVLMQFFFSQPPEFDENSGLIRFPVSSGMCERDGFPAEFRIVSGNTTFAKGTAGPQGQARISPPPGFDRFLIGMKAHGPSFEAKVKP